MRTESKPPLPPPPAHERRRGSRGEWQTRRQAMRGGECRLDGEWQTMPSVHVISWVTAYIIDKTRSSAHVIQTILCPDYFILCGLFHSVKTHVGEYDALDTEKMRTREACTAANNMTRGANMTPGANMTRGANMAWATNMARAGEGRRWGGGGGW